MKSFLVLAITLATAALGQEQRLPTGHLLDPVSAPHKVGNFPLGMVPSPDGKQLVLLLSGWRQQGIQVIDRDTLEVLQTIEQPAAFVGLTFSPDGQHLYASGGNDDCVYVYRWEGGRAVADGKIELMPPKKHPKDSGVVYPAGMAFSGDGKLLYVAENLGDTVAVIDVGRRSLVQRANTDRYPYGVVVDGQHVYLSCWGDMTLSRFTADAAGLLGKQTRIPAGRHPSALLLSGKRLFVASATTDSIAVLDTATGRRVRTLNSAPPAGPHEGSTPNALAISHDGKRLFVAEADSNSVAIFDVATGKLLGRVPAEWYPSALARIGSTIFVANGKGSGSAPNPKRRIDATPRDSHDYTLGQLDGSVLSFGEDVGGLDALSNRVAKANGWNVARTAAKYPPFKHVIYIIKENRTYDQVFGDMPEGDGDRALTFFDQSVSPNHHALAKRFGLYDRFFVNAEVSADGHNWSTAAYASDYVSKTVSSQYGHRGRPYDYGGENRDRIVSDEDDVNAPSTGYLWDLAVRKKISLRDYGEFTTKGPEFAKNHGVKRALLNNTAPDYIGWDLDVQDQRRMDAWLAEFKGYVADGNLPALEIMSLPNDHTSGGTGGKPTPRAYMADNDLALGRLVEALSNSPYWRDTVVFVLEDDAQSGPDHVDSHRSVFLAISAYSRAGVVHRFINTTDVVATIEEILGLGSMSQYDYFGRPLRGIFTAEPDLTPYTLLPESVDLNEKNPPEPEKKSAQLDLTRPDASDDELFNRILWETIKGPDVPYPGATRAPVSAFVGR